MSFVDKLPAIPDPWNRSYLFFLITASVVSTATVCLDDIAGALPAAAVWGACVLAVFALVPSKPTEHAIVSMPRERRLALLAVSILLLVTGLELGDAPAIGWIVVLGVGAAGSAAHVFWNCNRMTALLIDPLLMSLSVFATAMALGETARGAFPAVLVLILSLVIFALRNLENMLNSIPMEQSTEAQKNSARRVYHRTIAYVATLLFFFGIVALWPWLGKIYSDAYFWVLIIGVLSPILFFWNRLRQPRGERIVDALIRLNRWLPYISVILLLSFVVG